VPIDPNPDEVGDPCTVEGSGVSGVDTCEIHSMCWGIDPETLEGTCAPFCVGSPANPLCEDSCSSCSLSGDGVLTLCLPECDPVGQNCSEGQGCYFVNDGFVCAPDASAESGAAGDPCEFLNACDAGNFCASGESVPDCETIGCCTPFCEVANPTACDALPGSVCTPLDLSDPGCFGEGAGVCLLP
jgi:hypothetical protein